MAELIPLEVLLGDPERVNPRLSPDGERLAFLAPLDGVLNLWMGSADANDYVPITRDRDRGIHSYGWAHNGRHLYYVQDVGGDENWRLHTIDLASGDVVDRTPFEGVQVRLAGRSRRHADELLLGINANDRRFHDLYHLDLLTGSLERRLVNPGFDQWLTDNELNVRGAIRTTDDGGKEYLMGGGGPADWIVVLIEDPEDAPSEFLGFDVEDKTFFLLSPAGWTSPRLVRFDPTTGGTDVVFQDPVNDVTRVVLHPEHREPQLLSVIRARRELVVLDDSIRDDIALLEAADPGEFHLVNRDHADRRWVVLYSHDDGPISYYLYDRAEQKQTFLFHHQPDLTKYTLAKVEPFSFTASDGLTIHGYATAPPGVDLENLPTVLHVHGGPWGARHSWGFNADAQWLANRGYLCLEINFRGSGGYGKDFLNASAREWAGKMHTDLTEGANWAVDQGWADPDRIGILGASYGGYAALVGATFTPDFFRCAVDICGPSNLITLLETTPPYWAGVRKRFFRLLGNPDHDREFLWDRSPLSRVDQIRIPLLIGQGANDPRVKQAESDQIVAAMAARGIEHEYVVFPDEGHGFRKPENRLRFYQAAEAFLAKHL